MLCVSCQRFIDRFFRLHQFAQCLGVHGFVVLQRVVVAIAGIVKPLYHLLVRCVTVFGEWPDWIAWTGIALILGGGLFIFWREAALDKPVASERPMPRNR